MKSGSGHKLLFMSATNSERTVGDITSMLGVTMPTLNMIWGDAKEFFKSNVRLRVLTYVQRKRHLTSALGEHIFPHEKRQFIVYSNFAKRCAGLRKSLYEILHSKQRSDYIVMLTREDFSEQKEFSIRAFVGDIDYYWRGIQFGSRQCGR